MDIGFQYDRDLVPGRLKRLKALVTQYGFVVTAAFESPPAPIPTMRAWSRNSLSTPRRVRTAGRV